MPKFDPNLINSGESLPTGTETHYIICFLDWSKSPDRNPCWRGCFSVILRGLNAPEESLKNEKKGEILLLRIRMTKKRMTKKTNDKIIKLRMKRFIENYTPLRVAME